MLVVLQNLGPSRNMMEPQFLPLKRPFEPIVRYICIVTMKRFELILHFDNEEQTLSETNGLGIAQLGQLLLGMNKALKLNDEEQMILSDIKSNCYAPVFTTPNENVYNRSTILHEQIAQGDPTLLTKKERQYSNVLYGILETGMTLEVYNPDKTFKTKITPIDRTEKFNHFYETDAIRGILTKIGSRNLNTKIKIKIDSLSEEVEISKSQEKVLKEHFKKDLLEFYITKKINSYSARLENITLDDFEVLSSTGSFYTQINSIRERHGSYVSTKNK